MRIGSAFPAELGAAGISLDGISWDPDAGTIIACPDAVRDRVTAVLAAHDPSRVPPPRRAFGYAIRDGLKMLNWDAAWQMALSGQSQDTRDWWSSGYRDLIPIDAKKLVRVAGACVPPVDLNKLYSAIGA